MTSTTQKTATFRQLRTVVTQDPQWDAYRTARGIGSASALSKYELENVAYDLGYKSHADVLARHAEIMDGTEQDAEDQTEDWADMEDDPTPAPAPAPAAAPVVDPLASLRDILSPTMIAGADKAVRAVVADLEAARRDLEAARQAASAAAFVPVGAGDGSRPKLSGGTLAERKPFRNVIGGRKHDFPVATFTGADRVPAPDADYSWPDTAPLIVRALERSDFATSHVMLYGPKGTGKTSFAVQYAAATGRPCFLVPFDADKGFADLFGFPAPAGEGMEWHPGVLLSAMQVPNAVIALEEIGAARPELTTGPLQTLLQSGFVDLSDGVRAHVAPGVKIIATNNNNGSDLSPGAYHGLRPINDALRDRFSLIAEIEYLTPAREAKLLARKTGAPEPFCRYLCDFAGRTRKLALSGHITAPVGFRRLLAWAALSLEFPDDLETAYDLTVKEGLAEDDRAYMQNSSDTMLDFGDLRRLLVPAVGGASPDASPATSGDVPTRAGFTATETFVLR